MGQRAHLAAGAGLLANIERATVSAALGGLRQHVAGEAVGERGLADPLRAGEEPGMMKAPAGERRREHPSVASWPNSARV